MPTGCNEQKSRVIGTIVYTYKYLKATNQLINRIKSSGESWISIGLQAIATFRQPNGSYNLWANNKNNIWMTAHIVKLLGQVAEFSSIVQKSHITAALDYLRDSQSIDGSFSKADMINKHWTSSSLTGHMAKTAFVLIAILENAEYADRYRETINKGLNYIHLDIAMTEDPYVLAMCAYAFALNGEKTDAGIILDELDKMAVDKNGDKYWVPGSSNCKESLPKCIEIASYALLANVAADRNLAAVPIERWLIKQGNFYSGRGSTQSTILATQALAKMAAINFDDHFVMDLKLSNDRDASFDFVVDKSNCLERQVRSLPEDTKKVKIDAWKRSGKGNGYVIVEYQYTRKEANVSKNFELDVDVRNGKGNEVELVVCSSFISDGTVDQTAMTLMEIEMPSGYVYDLETDLTKQNLAGFQVYFDILVLAALKCVFFFAEN
jgi:CD109 antigen